MKTEHWTPKPGSAEAWQHASVLCLTHRQRTMRDAARLYYTKMEVVIVGAAVTFAALRLLLEFI